MTQRVTPQPLKIELARFLSGCLARHAPLAAERHVTLTRVDAEGTAWLDCAMIGRVLDNLITNAIRHAPEGGRVTLTAERQKASPVIFVADNGAGVAPELTGKLFEPFVTGRAARGSVSQSRAS